MKKAIPLKLKKSETAVLHAASRIYAAHIASGQTSLADEKDLFEKSIETAIAMARRIDAEVRSDEEMA